MKIINFLINTLLVICLSYLYGCSTPQQNTLEPHSTSAVQKANYYLKLAQKKGGAIYLNKLKAADYLIKANHIDKAEQLIGSIPSSIPVGSQEDCYSHILLAQIALLKKTPLHAQRLLNHIWTPQQLSPSLRTKYFEVKANIHLRDNNHLAATEERIALAQHAITAQEQQANNQAIWNILSQLTPNSLRAMQTNSSSKQLSGWLSFAHLSKQYDSSPEQLSRALTLWKKTLP